MIWYSITLVNSLFLLIRPLHIPSTALWLLRQITSYTATVNGDTRDCRLESLEQKKQSDAGSQTDPLPSQMLPEPLRFQTMF